MYARCLLATTETAKIFYYCASLDFPQFMDMNSFKRAGKTSYRIVLFYKVFP